MSAAVDSQFLSKAKEILKKGYTVSDRKLVKSMQCHCTYMVLGVPLPPHIHTPGGWAGHIVCIYIGLWYTCSETEYITPDVQ